MRLEVGKSQDQPTHIQLYFILISFRNMGLPSDILFEQKGLLAKNVLKTTLLEVFLFCGFFCGFSFSWA